MTDAERIAADGLPSEFDEAAAEVSEAAKQAFKNADVARQASLNEGDDEDLAAGLLEQRLEDHGLHAYRYEELPDGSAIAIWSNTKSGGVKVKAFADMQEASRWSPREER